ncbi:MAG: hypothetical protein WAW13_02030 [Minisyncoccia bacterium]
METTAEVGRATIHELRMKFSELVNLGHVEAPPDYSHSKRIGLFLKRNRGEFNHVRPEINDANFPYPSRIIKPGDKFLVRVFHYVGRDSHPTMEQQLQFLALYNAVHTGPQGASLVFEQRRGKLPMNTWYASLDENNQQCADGTEGIPGLIRYADGAFCWHLGCFKHLWVNTRAFFCFTEVTV